MVDKIIDPNREVRNALLVIAGCFALMGSVFVFLERNTLHCITLPPTEQILEFVKARYGPMDFDDFAGLSDWEKKYYESLYTPRKEKEK